MPVTNREMDTQVAKQVMELEFQKAEQGFLIGLYSDRSEKVMALAFGFWTLILSWGNDEGQAHD